MKFDADSRDDIRSRFLALPAANVSFHSILTPAQVLLPGKMTLQVLMFAGHMSRQGENAICTGFPSRSLKKRPSRLSFSASLVLSRRRAELSSLRDYLTVDREDTRSPVT